MNSNRLPLILLLIGLGLVFYQVFHHSGRLHSQLGYRFFVARGDLPEDENDVDLSVHSHPKKVIKHEPVVGMEPRVAPNVPLEKGQAAAPAAPVPGGPSIEDLAKQADAKLDAEKKKKKKKKKVVSATPDETANNQPPAPPPVATPNPADQYTSTQGGYVGQPGATPTPSPSPNSATGTPEANAINAMINNWKELLLKSPNAGEVQAFINEHKMNAINDEVFLAVTSAMAADPRPQMQALAATCYASYPSLKSFEGLVSLMDGSPAGSTVHTQATTDIAAYAAPLSPADMNALAGALTATQQTSPSLHLEAVQTIDAAAKQFSQILLGQGAGMTGTTPGSGTNPGQVSISSVNAADKNFMAFIGPLTQLARQTGNSALSSAAAQSLTDVQAVLTPQQNLTGIQ